MDLDFGTFSNKIALFVEMGADRSTVISVG
jgi:hypothetical protein